MREKKKMVRKDRRYLENPGLPTLLNQQKFLKRAWLAWIDKSLGKVEELLLL